MCTYRLRPDKGHDRQKLTQSLKTSRQCNMRSTILSGNEANTLVWIMKVNLTAGQSMCKYQATAITRAYLPHRHGSHASHCVRRAAYTVLTFMQDIAGTRLSGLVCILNLDISTALAMLLSILVLHVGCPQSKIVTQQLHNKCAILV